VHAQAATADDTDWWQIAALYEVLLRVSPSPMAALSRSVAVSIAHGPSARVALADTIAAEGSLAHSHLLHATRADMLGRLGRSQEAGAAYRPAVEQAGNQAQSRLLQRKLADLPEPSQPRTTR